MYNKAIKNSLNIIFSFFFIIILFTACSNTNMLKKDNIKNTISKNKKIKDSRYKNNPLVSSYDVNKDGIADMWKIFKNKKNSDNTIEKILIRREIDLNFDGKINYYKFYTDSGSIKKEYIDFNLDGIVDSIRYYEKNLINKEEEYKENPIKKDLTVNKKIKIYKRILYFNKKVTRIIIDRNNDGYLDQYLFFRKNKLVQIGFDEDKDGKIDIRVRIKKKSSKEKEINKK